MRLSPPDEPKSAISKPSSAGQPTPMGSTPGSGGGGGGGGGSLGLSPLHALKKGGATMKLEAAGLPQSIEEGTEPPHGVVLPT